jgi:hypothetical protein
MQSLKYLTIQGNYTFMRFFTFPSLISLGVSVLNTPTEPLSGHIIPHRVETVRIDHVEIDLEDIGRINPLRNIREFEAVDSTILCKTHGMFSLPKVQNLHIEDVRTNGIKEPHGQPDLSFFLNAHESMESLHSLSIVRMRITTMTINTLQMLKGLSKLTIERATFEQDAFELLRDILIPPTRGTTFPSLQFLNLKDLLVYKGEQLIKVDGNQVFTDIN